MVFICIGIIGVLGMVPTGGSGCCSRMLKGERSMGCVNVKGDPVRFDSSGTRHIDVVLGQHLFLLNSRAINLNDVEYKCTKIYNSFTKDFMREGWSNMSLHGLHRAKKINGSEWIVGHYVYCEGKHFIKNGSTFNEGWHEINEDTLGKYCEINDVSNQMIFEGDILEDRHYDYFMNLTLVDDYVVKYPPRRFGFVLQSIGCYLDPKSKDGYKLPREANKMKIIGNIFDTPDLLQEINALGRTREGKQIEY